MGAARTRAARARGAAAGAIALAAVSAAVGLPVAIAGKNPQTKLISKSTEGKKGEADSEFPSVSKDGRYVAFRSKARNLHPDDTDARSDVYVRDRNKDKTILVSRASGANGEKGDGSSFNPRISANGKWVAFRSRAPNLHPDDTDKLADIFIRNLETHQVRLISRATGPGGEKANGESFNQTISADGSVIAFRSEATNLDPADDDKREDIYVRSRDKDTTELISRASGPSGAKGNDESSFPVISGDGSLVAYRSEATNLHPDQKSGDRTIYARELKTNKTIIVSRAKGAGGKVANGDSTFASVSESGRYVAFDSLADNLTKADRDRSADVLLRDLKENKTSLISRASGFNGPKQNEGAAEPSISASGRWVAFHSTGTNLDGAEGDFSKLDVFVRDTKIGRTVLMSRTASGKEANLGALEPWIAGDGSAVAFHTEATNLSKKDKDSLLDVYVRPIPTVPKCLGKRTTQWASDGAKTHGSAKKDVIHGNPGADNIKARGGKDRVCGDGGADKIEGGKGDDRLNGGKGKDRCGGGPGKDRQKNC